jgi:hypothetical protein
MESTQDVTEKDSFFLIIIFVVVLSRGTLEYLQRFLHGFYFNGPMANQNLLATWVIFIVINNVFQLLELNYEQSTKQLLFQQNVSIFSFDKNF